MSEWLDSSGVLQTGYDLIRGLLLLIAGGVLALLLSRLARRIVTERFTPAQAEVTGRLVLWGVLGLSVVSALREVGFDLSVFMGAAGLLTVAVGFASQTSASNLISGLFLLFERPFSIRDVIRVGGTTGEVVSIDLLSVRLRTFDNLLVRVPNETLLKSEITNLSHFPLRRFDLQLTVGFDVDLEAVRELLCTIANEDRRVLDEPRVVAHFVAFNERGAQFQLSAWAARESFVEVKNELPVRLHNRLKAEGILLPVSLLPPRA